MHRLLAPAIVLFDHLSEPELELEEAARVGRYEDEGWRIRKDGTRFWANVVISALHDDQGKLIGFAKVTRDLTDRRNAKGWPGVLDHGSGMVGALEERQQSQQLTRLIVLEADGHLDGRIDAEGLDAPDLAHRTLGGKSVYRDLFVADLDRCRPVYRP